MRIASFIVGCLPVLLASECEDLESNEDFGQCKSFYQEQLLDCSSSCKTDPACESQCSRDYDENLKSCPCQEYCPGGCPCPSYECGPKYDTECGQNDPSLNWFSLELELEDGTTGKKCFAFVNEEEATQYAEYACNEHKLCYITMEIFYLCTLMKSGILLCKQLGHCLIKKLSIISATSTTGLKAALDGLMAHPMISRISLTAILAKGMIAIVIHLTMQLTFNLTRTSGTPRTKCTITSMFVKCCPTDLYRSSTKVE